MDTLYSDNITVFVDTLYNHNKTDFVDTLYKDDETLSCPLFSLLSVPWAISHLVYAGLLCLHLPGLIICSSDEIVDSYTSAHVTLAWDD